jgi:hypothetical protein
VTMVTTPSAVPRGESSEQIAAMAMQKTRWRRVSRLRAARVNTAVQSAAKTNPIAVKPGEPDIHPSPL